MLKVGPLAAEMCWRLSGSQTNFNGFRVLPSLLHDILYWAAILCGVEQRLPDIFGTAAITMGIGPHCSF